MNRDEVLDTVRQIHEYPLSNDQKAFIRIVAAKLNSGSLTKNDEYKLADMLNGLVAQEQFGAGRPEDNEFPRPSASGHHGHQDAASELTRNQQVLVGLADITSSAVHRISLGLFAPQLGRRTLQRLIRNKGKED